MNKKQLFLADNILARMRYHKIQSVYIKTYLKNNGMITQSDEYDFDVCVSTLITQNIIEETKSKRDGERCFILTSFGNAILDEYRNYENFLEFIKIDVNKSTLKAEKTNRIYHRVYVISFIIFGIISTLFICLNYLFK